MPENNELIASIRRRNLQKEIDDFFDGKPLRLSKKIGRSATFYYDLLAGRKSFGEKLARKLASQLGRPADYFDRTNDNAQINENTLDYKIKGTTLKNNTYNVVLPIICWSEFCSTPNSINKTELISMLIENDIDVSKDSYLIEIDNNNFATHKQGEILLIDPNATPIKGSTIIISVDDEIPTLARWMPGLGELYIEPLEAGYPGSISLEKKNFKIFGVAIIKQHKPERL